MIRLSHCVARQALKSVTRRCISSQPIPDNIFPDDMIRPPLTLLSENEMMFRDSTQKFATEVVQPLVREMDDKSQLDPSVIQGLFDQGFMGIEIPEEYDGTGASFMSAILVVEELARIDPSVSVFCDVQNTLVDTLIVKLGTDAQKEAYLPKLATDTVGSFCLSEAGSGSDAFAMRTSAKKRW